MNSKLPAGVSTVVVAVVGLGILVIGFFILQQQHQQALTDKQAIYCARVAAGDWPDFHHSYAAECEPTFGPAKPFVPYTEK